MSDPNLPDGCTQADLDRHLDGWVPCCPACGAEQWDCAPDCDRAFDTKAYRAALAAEAYRHARDAAEQAADDAMAAAARRGKGDS